MEIRLGEELFLIPVVLLVVEENERLSFSDDVKSKAPEGADVVERYFAGGGEIKRGQSFLLWKKNSLRITEPSVVRDLTPKEPYGLMLIRFNVVVDVGGKEHEFVMLGGHFGRAETVPRNFNLQVQY